MKRGVMLMSVVGVGLLIGFPGTDVVYAADGKTANAVQLRSGPGEQFPGVTRLAKGLKIDVHGCLRDSAWCGRLVARPPGMGSGGHRRRG